MVLGTLQKMYLKLDIRATHDAMVISVEAVWFVWSVTLTDSTRICYIRQNFTMEKVVNRLYRAEGPKTCIYVCYVIGADKSIEIETAL